MRDNRHQSRILVREVKRLRQILRQALALLLVAVMPSSTIVTAGVVYSSPLASRPAAPDRHLGSTSNSPSFGTPVLSSGIRGVHALPQSGSSNGVAVSVAYADNLTPSMNFPTPWQGSPNVAFYGGGATFNAGAIRLDNTTSSPITVDSVTVDLQRPGPVFNLWTNLTIPANGSAILTQTASYSFDTSSYPIVSCGGTIPNGDTRVPLITVTQGGTSTSYQDTSHVLDTGGFDLSCRGNRSLAWRPIGTTGIEAPSAGITASPNGSITETGNPVALQAQVLDAAGQTLANALVSFSIKSGPNSGMTNQTTTNGLGIAQFSYASLLAGSDSIQASLTNLTGTNLNAAPVLSNWTSEGPCPTPTPSTPGSTNLIYVGQTSAHVGDTLLAAALLTDSNGNGLAGQTISFTFRNSTMTWMTDSTGVARANFAAPGVTTAPLGASFAGTATLSAANTTATIAVSQENTEITYTGPTVLTTASAQQLSATLTDLRHGLPLPNETLTFQVGSTQASAITNASGVATVSMTLPSNPTTGPGQIQVSFAGDTNYLPSYTAAQAIIAVSSAFVIWGGNSGGLHLGQDVNFWGAQWASQVRGGNFNANPSFQGFAQYVGSFNLCEVSAGSGQQTLDDKCWNAKPGNSNPLATLPQYIEVIVSNAIAKQGSEIYGNIASLAVLKVDSTPVYGPDPGHPGYGVIVAVLQDGAGVFPTPVSLSATQSQPATVLPGQTYTVTTQVTNSGQTAASNVVASESFDGTQPPTGSQSDTLIASSGQFTADFSETAPSYPVRQSNETSTAYETRLAGVDGRRFTSTGTVTFTDSVGEPYRPVNVSSHSLLQLPRLDVSLNGPACVSPSATIPYVVTITNLGSATATAVTGTLTLPDGSVKTISASNLAAGTSSVTKVKFQLAPLALAGGTILTATANVNWQDEQGNNYGTVTEQVSSTTQHIPIVSKTPAAPGVSAKETSVPVPAAAATAQTASTPVTFPYAIFATASGCGAINLSGSAYTDAFNSNVAPYSSQHNTNNGSIASESNVTLSGSATVGGTIYAANTTVGTGCVFSGGKVNQGISSSGTASCSSGHPCSHQQITAAAPSSPSVPAPTFSGTTVNIAGGTTTLNPNNYNNVNKANSVNISGSANVTFPAGTYYIYNLTVSGRSTITLGQGAYYLNSINLSGSSFLYLAMSSGQKGPVTLNIAGSGQGVPINLSGGTIVNQTLIASNLEIFYAGTGGASLSGGANAYFAVDAPSAAVTLSGTTAIYGAIVGATINDSAGAAVHFDQALSQLPQTITFPNPGTQTYGVAPITLAATASSGLPVTYSVISGAATVSGSKLTITGAGTVTVEADQAGNSSYLPAPPVQQTFAVNKAVLGVTASNATMTYGGTLPTFTATYSGFVNGDTVSVLTGAPSLTTTATSASPAGAYPITAAQGTLVAANYTFTFTNGTLTIGKAVLTVSAQNATMTYGGTLPTFTASYSGFVNGDTKNVLTGAPSLTTTATSASPAGAYPITAAQGTLVAANYTFTFANGTLTIQQAPVAVTLGNLVQTYSGSPEPVSVATVPAGVSVAVSYTGINGTAYGPSTTAPTNPGTYTAVAAVTNPNFAGGTSATLTINQLNPSLSLALLAGMPEPSPYGTRVYFELTMPTAPCPTGHVQFWVDNVASGVPVTLNGTNCTQPIEFSTATLTPGSHSMYAVYSGDTFYAGETSGMVTHNVVADATAVTLATSAGSVNVGQTVTFTATVTPSPEDPSAVAPSGTVKFYDGGVLLGSSPLSAAAPYTASFSTAVLPAGTHSVTATYVSANGLYSGSSSAVTVETVNKIAPAITWAQPADIVYGTALSSAQLNATATDNGNPVSGTFTYNPAAGTALPAGTRNLQVTFTPADSATYTTQTASVTINVKPAVLTVTANSASMTYGGSLPTFTASYSGFVNGDTTSVLTGAPSLTTTATSASTAGTYTITAAQGTLAAANYTFTSTNGTLTIGKAVLTVTAQNATMTYGGTLPTFTATYSGFVNGDTVSVLTGAPSLTTTATSASSAGAYPITPAQGTLSAPNYSFVFVSGTLTITRAYQAITFPNPGPQTYPGSPITLAATASSGLAVVYSVISGPATVNGSTLTITGAGSVTIEADQPGNANYAAASPVQQSFTVQAVNAPPVVTAGPNQTVPFPNDYPLQGKVTSANTPPGTPTALWSVVSTNPSGLAVTFTNPTSPTSIVKLNAAGTYVFQLTGTEKGVGASAQVTITAVAGNKPPVVNAGPDQQIELPTNTATLTGSATDATPNVTLTYTWSQISGPGTATIANPTSPTTSITFPATGTYTFRLTVSDGQLTGIADTHVTEHGLNQPPVVNAGPNQLIALPTNTVTLNGSATDDGLPVGSTLRTTWSKVSGPGTVEFGNPIATNTTALFTAVGVYDLRLTADDSQYRTSADVTITVNQSPPGSIILSPQSASPIPVGTAQQFQASVKDGNGVPAANLAVSFTTSGTNTATGTATTDANGNAAFSYTGTSAGLDSVTATATLVSTQLASNTALVSWVASAPQVSASAVTGRFFTSDGSGTFDTPASAQPVFSQTFGAVNFNPATGTIPGAPNSIDVTTRPFTGVTTDANGNYTGNVVAQGNGYQAGVGTLASFQAVFTGTLTVAAAGDVTFNFTSADGFVFGIGNAASRVSGTFVDPPTSGSTTFNGYAVMGSFNTVTAPVANTITVNFPGAGTYPYELDYTASNQTSLITPGSLWKYSLNNPAGFYQPNFDDSSFVLGLAPFTNAIGYQSPGFSCPLVGSSYFPVLGTVDLRKNIYLPGGATNVIAQVAIDNDFTLWVNGTQVTNQQSEGCAFEWNRTVSIPDNLWVPGNNVVAVQARDRGGATGFEMQMIESAGTNQTTRPLTLTMNIDKSGSQKGITLSPANNFTASIGQTAKFTAVVTDASGALVPNQPVTFNVAGANPQQALVATDNTGTSTFTYHGFTSGIDVVQAQALVTGATLISGQTSVIWGSVGNQPPVVNAGPDQAIQLPVNTVTLNGTVIDDGLPVGAPLTQEWNQISGPAASPANGYSFGQVIVVDHTKVPNTDQPHFPLLISGTYPFLATVANGGDVANASGFDIIFTSDAAGTSPLPYERESYNPATGAGIFWVSVPLLSHTTDTTIYLFYGNPSITTDQSNKSGVWDSNYKGVWHFPDGTTLSANDSTSNGNNGVISGAVATAGEIGGGANFGGGSARITVNTSGSLAAPFTIEEWAKPADLGHYYGLFGSRTPGDSSFDAKLTGSGAYSDIGTGSSWLAITSFPFSYAANTWHHFVYVVDTTGYTVYGDGSQIGSGTLNGTALLYDSNHNLLVGATGGGGESFNGAIDETRVSNVARSADWIATEYNNQSSPATFYSIVRVGGLVTFSNPGQSVTQATFSAAGTYVLQLSASDTQYTTTSNVTVTVYPASEPSQPQPPVVSAGPSQTAIFPNTVTLSGSVTDSLLPPGAELTSMWSVLGGPGTVTFGNATSPVTTASFSATGTYLLQLSASNTQYTSTATTTVNVMPAPITQNQPPSVGASALSPVVLPNAVTLNGTATDDGLPNQTLTVQWTALTGPGTVTFANATSANTTATFSAAGTYTLQLSASDTQYTSSVTLTIVAVNAPSSGAQNQPPVVSAGPARTITLPATTATLHGLATDDGLPYGTLTIGWTEVSGPAPVTFGNQSAAQTSATFSVAGVYLLQLSAFDGQYTATAQTTVTVTSSSSGGGTQDQPPTVSAGPNLTIYLPSNSATLNGSASSASGKTLTVTWSEISGPGTVTYSNPSSAVTQVTFPGAGTFVLQLSATDGQLTSTVTTAVTVVAQPPPPPTVHITAPTDGTEITMPTPVTGTVSNGNWVLQYAQLVPDNPSAQVWTTFASGSGAASGTLGTLDPTILLNGEYSIQLMTIDSAGQFATASISVAVDRNMKVGVFSLAFNDLSVPVAGFPIQITRSYDSRDKSSGDFGVGWRLAIANARVQKNHNLGFAWQQTVGFTGFLTQYCVQPTIATTVTVTFPDGKVYSFQPSLSPSCQLAGPISTGTLTFVQLPGPANTAGATLAPADGGSALVEGDVPGPSSLYGFDGNIYNPTQFTLTTAQGVTYTIDQALGVTGVKDLNGNSLTITASNVTSSTGKSVAINRNGQGFVTSITDPNGVSMSYGYDGNNNLISYTDRATNATKYAYDGSHNLTGITLPNGQSGLSNAYDPATGRLTGTTDGNGVSTTFTHNVAAQTEVVTDRNGNPTTYLYDTDGNVLQVTDALNHTTYSTYDSNDNKLTDTNALGKTSIYTYDQFGNRLTETDPLQHMTAYTYGPVQQVLTVTDPLTHTTTNAYDANGNLLNTKDALGNQTTNLYSPNGLLAQTTDALHQVTQFSYDGSGNVKSQTDAASTTTSYTYDNNGNRLTQAVTRTFNAAPQTLTTQYQYDGNNRLTKTTYPDGSFTQVQYNSLGQQSATIDAKNNTTTYTYDNDGRLTLTKYPDGTTESSTYDGNGNRLTSTDRAGHITTYTYDLVNRLTKTTYDDNSFTQTGYDAAGQVLTSQDANGNVTTYVYDDAGRRTSLTDALTHVTTFVYDAAGNQTSVLDANHNTTTYIYDSLNRQTQVTYPDSKFELTGYDVLGRVASRTDANGKMTAYGYDSLGRLTSVTQDAVAGGLNLLTQYTYDEVGNRLTQTDANNHTTQYAYDQRGRRTGRALPAGQSETYAYDANGNLSSRTDFNARTTTYTYDTVNRLLSKAADPYFVTNRIGAAAESFTYTVAGKRATLQDASGTTTYGYDTRDRLTSKATPEGTLSYTYDPAGSVKTIQSSNAGGASITYGYDALDRLNAVTDANGATSYTYDPVGNLGTVTHPNGVTHVYSYDTRNRLTNLGVAKGATAIASYGYTLDAVGHRTSVTELSGRKVNYAYDNLYRLTNETIASDPNAVNGAISYTYDAVGNRKQMTSTVPGLPAGLWNYDANDRFTAGDTYDNDGNTVSSGGIANVYDFENRLVQQGGLSIVYDGDGNRVSKTVAGLTTKYLVDDANPTGYAQVMDEVQASTAVRTYTWGLELINELFPAGSPLATNHSPLYYVFDGHGSVRALTNAAGAVTDTYDYDAFGILTHSSGTTPNNYLFASEQYDPDLGLYYNRARYLNTNTGRFWSMDTEEGDPESPGSLHKYSYVRGDSVNEVDPSGNGGYEDVLITAGLAVTIFALAALHTQILMNSIRTSLENATTNAGELYSSASYAASRAIADAELATQAAYFSVTEAIDKAKETVKDKYRRLKKKFEDLKVVPISIRLMPNIAAHIGVAQVGGYPAALTRATPEQAVLNRAAALVGHPPGSAGPGMSWDEYPFASSMQGGAGASVAAVPVREQAIQGGTIAASYLLQNITVGDGFWVVIIP